MARNLNEFMDVYKKFLQEFLLELADSLFKEIDNE